MPSSINSRPTLVLDIAPLGFAFRNGSRARGIHRVVQHLFNGLVRCEKFDLRFVATSGLAPAWEMMRTLHPDLLCHLYWRPGQLLLSRRAERAFAWVERTLKNRAIYLRATRFLVQAAGVWADLRSFKIPKRALDGADIYHSPLAPFPEAVCRLGIRKFLTVYDLLPLTNPESVPGKDTRPTRDFFRSIPPDASAFCIAEGVKRDLLQYSRLDPRNIYVTPLAADPGVFHPVEDEALRARVRAACRIPESPYFLAVSSFDPRKNFGHIIRCFARLVEEGTIGDCNLVIVGSNPERNTFVQEALSKHPELKSRVILPGFIPDGNLAAIYTGALAFVFPSLGEGFGIPPLEAMQCGTPVISSNAPVLPEVLGEAAILLDPYDVSAWSSTMRDLFNNESLRQELRAKALARARLFSWDRFIHCTIEGYESQLEA